MSDYFKIEALSTAPHDDRDTVLAEALRVIEQHCPIEKFRAHRLPADIVMVQVEFWAANPSEAVAKAREVAETLNHRWPTDSVRVGKRGESLRPVKFVKEA